MSRYNRPMRKWQSAVLTCFACNGPITGETRMLGGELFHPLCGARRQATWGRPEALNAIAGESAPQRDVTRAQRGVR